MWFVYSVLDSPFSIDTNPSHCKLLSNDNDDDAITNDDESNGNMQRGTICCECESHTSFFEFYAEFAVVAFFNNSHLYLSVHSFIVIEVFELVWDLLLFFSFFGFTVCDVPAYV